MIEIIEKNGFTDWFNALTKKEQMKVAARLERIKNHEHFGDAKNIGNELSELRWKNGWRIYFIAGKKNNIVLVIGGHKNDQKKDIQKARLFIRGYTKI